MAYYFPKICSVLFIAIGFVSTFGSREWSPSFYQASFVGPIMILSPVLIFLPSAVLSRDTLRKKELISQLQSIIAAAFLMGIAGEFGLFQLYRFGFEYDKFMHFFVSMLFSFILCEFLVEWGFLRVGRVMFLAFGGIFLSGVLWEVIEFTSDVLLGTKVWGVNGLRVFSDTYKDLLFNIIGIISGIIIHRAPGKRNRLV